MKTHVPMIRSIRPLLAGFVVAACAGTAAAAPFVTNWDVAGNARFNRKTSWSNGVPNADGITRFNKAVGAGYIVTFVQNETSRSVWVAKEDVTLDLNTHTYTVTGAGFDTSVLIAHDTADKNSKLIVKDGKLVASRSIAAGRADTNGGGSLVVEKKGVVEAGANNGGDALRVTPKAGQRASVEVKPGGKLTTSGKTVIEGSGDNTKAEVIVHKGGEWISGGDITVGNGTNRFGTLDIRKGAKLDAGGKTITIKKDSLIIGTDNVIKAAEIKDGGKAHPKKKEGIESASSMDEIGTLTFDTANYMHIHDPANGDEGVHFIDIGGLLPGKGCDRINVTGLASIGGSLEVQVLPGYVPQVGDHYRFFTAGVLSGPGYLGKPDRSIFDVGGYDMRIRYHFAHAVPNISLHVVPAPGCAALLAAGGLAMLGRRRSR